MAVLLQILSGLESFSGKKAGYESASLVQWSGHEYIWEDVVSRLWLKARTDKAAANGHGLLLMFTRCRKSMALQNQFFLHFPSQYPGKVRVETENMDSAQMFHLCHF